MIRHNINGTGQDQHCSVDTSITAGSFERLTLELHDAEQLMKLSPDALHEWIAHQLLFPLQRQRRTKQ